MTTDSRILRCNHCGTRNRVPRDRLADRPICGKCQKPLPSSATLPVTVTDATFNAEIASFPGPVMLDCWAPWCGPCKMMAPVLNQLAKRYAGVVKIAKLNVDQNPLISQRFNVLSIPTMLLFNGGRLVNTLPGALTQPELERHLNYLAGGSAT
jgi:thioredoxin 2